MQGRIDRLETLVLSLMTNGGSPTEARAAAAAAAAATSGARSTGSADMSQDMEEDGPNKDRQDDSEVEQVSKSIGIMKVANDKQMYASEAHWFAILSDIAEVKNYFNEHKKQYDEQMRKVKSQKAGQATVGTSMLFKSTVPVDRSEILAQFPPRHVANELITRYFETENPGAHIIHRPTFRKQYEKHWTNPEQTSIAWMGMCFAMMCLALQSYDRAGDAPSSYRGRAWDQSLTYLEWTTQCMVCADFTQPVVYMVEALCLYLQAEHARSRDAETGVWILIGLIVRLAMRVGLHRDPRPFASLTPFQAEIRRRLWAFIRCSDILMSFQVGMPSLIKATDCDSDFPANLHDEEIDENIRIMPPSRPLSEVTPVSFMLINCQMTYVLGKILEATSSIEPISYETAMKLDGELREARTRIPPHLTQKTREESALDSASLIMQRYNLDLIYHKSQTMLHRKFLSCARENPRYDYSRKTCVDSCMEMLNHQVTLTAECQPGGRLHMIPWSVTATLTQHDFLLAAMIVCLDLYHTAEAESRGQTSGEMYQWAVERREAMFTAIDHSVAIWDTLRDQSMEAYKASVVLHVMLEKLRNHSALRQQMNSNFSFVPATSGVAMDAGVAPEHSAAMTLGMMSSGMTPDAMAGMYDRGFSQQHQQQAQSQQQSGTTPQSMGGTTDQQNAAISGMGAISQLNDPVESVLFAPFGGLAALGQTSNASTLDWVSIFDLVGRSDRGWLGGVHVDMV